MPPERGWGRLLVLRSRERSGDLPGTRAQRRPDTTAKGDVRDEAAVIATGGTAVTAIDVGAPVTARECFDTCGD